MIILNTYVASLKHWTLNLRRILIIRTLIRSYDEMHLISMMHTPFINHIYHHDQARQGKAKHTHGMYSLEACLYVRSRILESMLASLMMHQEAGYLLHSGKSQSLIQTACTVYTTQELSHRMSTPDNVTLGQHPDGSKSTVHHRCDIESRLSQH